MIKCGYDTVYVAGTALVDSRHNIMYHPFTHIENPKMNTTVNYLCRRVPVTQRYKDLCMNNADN